MQNTNNIKGKEFQRRVADLYRLLGAEVEEDIMIANKKVDLFANFSVPGGRSKHRIIIECKAEKKNRAQNQRIMEFAALLDIARRSGHAESAEIVTLEHWSEQAKGFAKDSGFQVLTYQEKLRNLIDFTSYVSKLVESVNVSLGTDADPPLATYYVSSRAIINEENSTLIVENILDYLQTWSNYQDDYQHGKLVVLGEFGSGKTSVSRMLAAKLAEDYLREPQKNRIPILLNLREFTKTIDIESFISSFLDHECGTQNNRFQLFNAMLKSGLFVLILDGFDEMATRTDTETLEINLAELEKLSAHPFSKIIITTRPEYFVSQKEQKKAWNPKTGEALLSKRAISYREIKILPWEDRHLEEFLQKRISNNWEYYRDQIYKIEDLKDLSCRPILAEMIVRTLPELLESKEKIDRMNLYNKYLLSELRRQKIDNRRKLLIDDEKRLELLEKFAVESYLNSSFRITLSEAKSSINDYFTPAEEDLIPMAREFLTCSFLVRTQNHFNFSHKSIQEYLTTKVLLREIINDSPNTIGRRPIDSTSLSFLIERKDEIREDILIKWIRNTRSFADAKTPNLGGNAATLLGITSPSSFANQDFTRIWLSPANLRGIDLRSTDFSDSSLIEVDLRIAKIRPDFFERVRTIKAQIHICFLLKEKYQQKDIEKIDSKLKTDFLPTVDAGQIYISGCKYFSEKGHSLVGVLDLEISNKDVIERVVKYLSSLREVAHAWILETSGKQLPISSSFSDHIISEIKKDFAATTFVEGNQHKQPNYAVISNEFY